MLPIEVGAFISYYMDHQAVRDVLHRTGGEINVSEK
jgi:hypothetical protein